MDRPVPSAPKRTPLTVSMGTTGMPAVQHQLPTVEEVSAGGIVVDTTKETLDVAWVPLQELGRRLSFPKERRIAALAREVLPEHL